MLTVEINLEIKTTSYAAKISQTKHQGKFLIMYIYYNKNISDKFAQYPQYLCWSGQAPNGMALHQYRVRHYMNICILNTNKLCA